MSLLSRNLRFAALLLLLFVASALPLPGPTAERVEMFPATAWAGGSPDETLNPQPPPQKSRGYNDAQTNVSGDAAASFRSGRSSTTLSWREKIGIALRVYLRSMLRF